MNPKALKRQWHSVTVKADPSAVEAVENAFGILDAIGITTQTIGKIRSETREIIGYFDEAPQDSEIETKLRAGLEIYGLSPDLIKDVTSDVVVEEDWLARWKEHWKPTRSGKFLITPPWDESLESGLIEIRIEPSMAFGTGTHETTQLCLELIGECFVPGMSFLDVGTGTGILSIAAAKMGGNKPGSRIHACDIDEEAIRIARQNAAQNESPLIMFHTGSVSDDTPQFDFVCANLTVDILEPLLPQLLRITGKHLVLSGILTEQEERIRLVLASHGAAEVEVRRKGEWIALLRSS